ncbi:type II toxin-antitoxin system YafQ family toxin [Phocoenobacter skyensis]|uniref:Type II toxin-antitoxin system YafQ family toxin n=1 Tax=Phocoenobacter skyensis TaxID=97481 RepID=A0A1H7XQ34_9PAST|nr:type II toxin-antitoxin system YafQ family toxin [Pasteurella skyensis]MDP8080084.1 type II toxin-antitoxin system YafQ family toxin [Pasteurella skyensis]MDP8086068.1 type II toxin-antitoxin system YafQ family toxin [Pasteurella skyensis]MDP8185767.1 type II toxin-antitoxin system YafQ family toxin [Pasteurella skyensis]QLB22654.1 addiction module toxin RelE [Pasteurella skyensis]SEM35297.1 mRNA interferase YafQ [Pasteurella skyensis]
MLKIEKTKAFEKDFKKVGLIAPLVDVLHYLINGKKLPAKYRDHALKGKYAIFRECHVKPDLLLVYYIENNILKLVRLASHSELF